MKMKRCNDGVILSYGWCFLDEIGVVNVLLNLYECLGISVGLKDVFVVFVCVCFIYNFYIYV